MLYVLHQLMICQILNKSQQNGCNEYIATEKLLKIKCERDLHVPAAYEYPNSTLQVNKRFMIQIDGSVTFKLQLGFESKYDRTLINNVRMHLIGSINRYISYLRACIVKEHT